MRDLSRLAISAGRMEWDVRSMLHPKELPEWKEEILKGVQCMDRLMDIALADLENAGRGEEGKFP
jgi:hypothetical protein